MRSARSQLTALRWVHEATHRTRVLNSTLDLSASRLTVLSRELGQSWYEVATNLGYAPTTIRRMSVVVRKFIEFAGLGDIEGAVSLASSGAALVECIHQWELSLKQGYAATSNLPYKDSMQLTQIIRWHIQSGRPAASLVRSRAKAKPLAPSRKETPVDELPNGTRSSCGTTAGPSSVTPNPGSSGAPQSSPTAPKRTTPRACSRGFSGHCPPMPRATARQ